MKERKIKVSELKKVHIATEIPNKADNTFDSNDFDSIPVEVIQKIFVKKYHIHKNAILDLVVSRLAMGTALTNIESSIKDAMEEAILVDTDKTKDSLDVGFTLALLAHGYNEAFSFITDEEVRKEIILTLLTGKKTSGTRSKGPVGYTKNAEAIEKDIQSITDKVAGKLEKDSDPVYGNVVGSKVGVLGRRNPHDR